jgi:hypothetical protein
VILDIATHPHLKDRLIFIDARTGLSNRDWIIDGVDDVAHSIRVHLMSRLLGDSAWTAQWIHVPRVVIDLPRLTVLYNVGDVVEAAPISCDRRIDEPLPAWPT